MGGADRDQRRHVRQLLRLRFDRPRRRFAAAAARLQRHADRHAQRDLQLPEHHHGAHRRCDRRSHRHPGVHADVRGRLLDRRVPDRALAALSDDGVRTIDFRSRRRVDDRRDHGRHRSMVRRPPAGIRLRREPEHRARRFLQRRHVDDVVQAALRPRLAAAAAARGRLFPDRRRRERRVLLPGTRCRGQIRLCRGRLRPTESCGAISSNSIARTGTSSGSA